MMIGGENTVFCWMIQSKGHFKTIQCFHDLLTAFDLAYELVLGEFFVSQFESNSYLPT